MNLIHSDAGMNDIQARVEIGTKFPLVLKLIHFIYQ